MTTSMQGRTDEQLMAEVRQGHQSALHALYDRFVNQVYGMALQKLGDPVEAQEITHEVFLNLWQGSSVFRASRGSAANWLLTTAHNSINGRFRQIRLLGENQEAIPQDPTVEPAAPESSQGQGSATMANEALKSLPDDEREVVELSYYQGNSQSDISRRLGVPLDVVKGRMRSAMTRLRTVIVGGGVE